MKVVKLRKKYVKKLKQYHDGTFPFPDLSNPLYIISGAVLDRNGNILGGGFVKLTAEAIIILRPEADKVQKSAAIMSLFSSARTAMITKGLDGVHAFTNDEIYGRFLKKRFGFKKSDQCYYLRLY